jgi:ribonuclease HI
MKKIKLFTDSSVNPQEKVGFGAYLLLKNKDISFEEMKKDIKTKRFEDTSSTKLELQTLLWSLEEINDKDVIIEIYTDCQNIIGLQDRRERLEKNNFHSSAGKLMNNHELYKYFFEKSDELNLTFIKVKGHKKNSLKDEIDTIFNLVDKASRNALRENMLI